MLLTLTSAEIQYFIIAVLFTAAAFYVGRIFWRSFFGKSEGACPKGCGGACGAIDVDRLQRTIEKAAVQANAK
ncbi:MULTISPECIES: FeoB-associated Cys-rich membrane protein [Hymenobacter]|uniref:FeoB-associated Cys-rich membrane protein n=1 Tax=Hymenobacter jejuensis TaxID=2502781 RepID=A0A5B8A0E6_9BACT|nr:MULTISPECIES: FeoB-associated Cys-rich membrane protein [Hymenobacter]MBC6991816.1 FeoB-associated Cys-rich membrane protein [Hymenobacter sp. BT491]QDA60135.1 FeoB-associated Cys-rich membrane protein [Hymenobacter jejuensis]